MPEPETTPLVCSGTSGFIGSHLAAALVKGARPFLGVDRVRASSGLEYPEICCDIQHLAPLCAASGGLSSGRLIHLAAEAEVLTPWDQIPSVFLSNLNGTWNLLSSFSPRVCVFASSSSVYGDTDGADALPEWFSRGPLGIYGSTKYAGEILLRDWASSTGGAAVLFRFGNVIGAKCRGLIPYLVQHALRYPDGSVCARMRGGGTLARDYVPVQYVTQMLTAAAEQSWPHGTYIFNLGTGRSLTNGQVAQTVRRVLWDQGYPLEIDWDDPVPAGEAHCVRLDVNSLQKYFGIAPPGSDAVEACIEESVLSFLRA